MIWNDKSKWPREGNHIFLARAFLLSGERSFGSAWSPNENEEQRRAVQEEIADACLSGTIRAYVFGDPEYEGQSGFLPIAPHIWMKGDVTAWFATGEFPEGDQIFLDGADFDRWNKPERQSDAPAEASPMPRKKGVGGRPPLPVWDDFWIELVRIAIVDDIHVPGDRTDLEKRMLQWLADEGHNVGKSTVSSKMTQLFERLPPS